jgi:GNAT superfamily N-acetyltransferase
MESVLVQPIQSSKDHRQFLKFPWSVYRDYPMWVPPLLMDRRKLMDRKKNPFYKHAEVEFFLARRNGQVVGRIGAIVNHNHNKEHKENIGFFGFFESINDTEVARTLFRTAASWLKAHGVTAMRGPASPSVNDEYGLLVDGFDKPPMVLMPYNPPYYPLLVEFSGLKKIKDLYAFEVNKNAISEKLSRVSEAVRQREGLTFRKLDLKNFKREITILKNVYNRAWQYNWGAVPMTDEEFDALAKDLKPVVNPELVIIAEFKGEPIGFSLSLPDLNVPFKHNKNGYLLPGLYCLFRYKKSIKKIRIIVLGVIKEFQKTGAASVLFYETARRAIANGYPRGEASWVLEDNTMMIRSAAMLNGERDKTYRMYQMPL